MPLIVETVLAPPMAAPYGRPWAFGMSMFRFGGCKRHELHVHMSVIGPETDAEIANPFKRLLRAGVHRTAKYPSDAAAPPIEIGRASCRERVCQYVKI